MEHRPSMTLQSSAGSARSSGSQGNAKVEFRALGNHDGIFRQRLAHDTGLSV